MAGDDQIDFTLNTPFSMQIVGPTFSGKTQWVLDLIHRRHEITKDRLNTVIYCYPEEQDKLSAFAKTHSDVIFTKNIDELPNLVEKNRLVVLDDLMMTLEGKDNSAITEIFIKGCHHRLWSIIIILQVNAIT